MMVAFGRSWPTFTTLDEILTKCWQCVRQIWPNVRPPPKNRRTRPHSGQHFRASSGQSRSKFGQFRATFGRFRRTLLDFGRARAQNFVAHVPSMFGIHRIRVNLGRFLAKFGRRLQHVAESGPSLADSGLMLVVLAPVRANSGRFLAKNWSCPGQMLAKRWPSVGPPRPFWVAFWLELGSRSNLSTTVGHLFGKCSAPVDTHYLSRASYTTRTGPNHVSLSMVRSQWYVTSGKLLQQNPTTIRLSHTWFLEWRKANARTRTSPPT